MLITKREWVNKLFFMILILSLIFGVFAYDYISSVTGFTYIDELLVLFLLILALYSGFKTSDYHILKEFKIFICISLFYLLYSLFMLKTNVPEAILMDYLIQVKPFIAFYAVCIISPNLEERQIKGLKVCLLLLIFLSLLVAVTDNIFTFFVHPSRYATVITVFSFVYLYYSDFNKRTKIIFMLLFALGFLSFKAKFYTFYAATIFCVIFFSPKMLKKKYIILTLFFVTLLTVLVFYVGWEKFQYYFIFGTEDVEESFARPALYMGSVEILKDYPIFGSGLATYATFTSGLYYSPIYDEYGLSEFWGLSKDNPDFISDTFFPQFAQFGLVGIVLFFTFWVIKYKKLKANYEKTGDMKSLLIGLLIFLFFLIESSTDSTLLHNRGMVMMILFALVLREKDTSLNELNTDV